MEILNSLLTAAYFLGIIASGLGVCGWYLEYKKSKGKKPFFIYGILASFFLAVTFLAIIVSVGLHPVASAYILKVAVRVSVIGYAVFKLVFESLRVSKLVSVDRKAAIENV